MKGTLERRVSIKNQIEVEADQIEVVVKAPDKYLRTMKTPQGVVVTHGLNGAAVWLRNNNTSRQASAEELSRLKRAAAIYDAVKVAEQPTQMRVIGTEKIGDREAYVVALTAEPNTARLEELKKQGVRGYLRKPFTPEAIRKMITETLGGVAHAA